MKTSLVVVAVFVGIALLAFAVPAVRGKTVLSMPGAMLGGVNKPKVANTPATPQASAAPFPVVNAPRGLLGESSLLVDVLGMSRAETPAVRTGTPLDPGPASQGAMPLPSQATLLPSAQGEGMQFDAPGAGLMPDLTLVTGGPLAAAAANPAGLRPSSKLGGAAGSASNPMYAGPDQSAHPLASRAILVPSQSESDSMQRMMK